MVQPHLASFSHIFGRRPTVLLALFFFALGAIIAAVANDFSVILVGRTVQGVGVGGVTVLNVIIADLIPLRERGKWFGYTQGSLSNTSPPYVL